MYTGSSGLESRSVPVRAEDNKPLWNIYENFNEGVYISTIDTHELIYMNRRLRDLMGFEGHQDYRGKKCYEVIQGLAEPCPFCTNDKLSNCGFYSWVHYNPVLQQRFLLKDALFTQDGVALRIEFAAEIDQTAPLDSNSFFHHSELVNQCIRYIQQRATTPDEVIQSILEFTMQTFRCTSVASFSVSKQNSVTMEYRVINPKRAAEDYGANSDSEIVLHSELWSHMMQTGRGVALHAGDEEMLRYPVQAAITKKYGMRNMVLEPLKDNGTVIGFLGGRDIPEEQFGGFVSFAATVSFILSTMYKQREAQKKLETIGMTDLMTGSNNSNAFLLRSEQLKRQKDTAMGVVYCDIPHVNTINATLGRATGDEHIKLCYQQISKVFDPSTIYRVGGNEFVVLKCNMSEKILRQKVDRLRNLVVKAGIEMSIGMAWDEHGNIQELIRSADQAMQSDHDQQGLEHQLVHPVAREPRSALIFKEHITAEDFLDYIYEGNYCISSLLQPFTGDGTSFGVYLGDLKSSLFYVSDSMRIKFGIREQVIPHFFSVWAKRIEMDSDREKYAAYLQEIVNGQRDHLNMKYRVRDYANRLIWIRHQASVQRDEEGMPLFYTGFISWQDQEFYVDLTTGFARDISAMNLLARILEEGGQRHTVVVFTPSNIRELNEVRGRTRTDQILRKLAGDLSDQMGRDMLFFRLDGVRFLGITKYVDDQTEQEIVCNIREIIDRVYREYDIPVQESCFLSLLHYPCEMESKEFLGAAITALRMAKRKKDKTIVEGNLEAVRKHHSVSAMALSLSKSVLHGFSGFRVVVQPIVSAHTGKIEKGEVLLRWQDEEKQVSPRVFIPILEETDLIIPVGKWVFEQTVQLLHKLLHYAPNFRLAFNVSYHQVADDDFLDFAERTLRRYEVESQHLTMELTESHLNDHPQRLSVFMKKCRDMGLGVALDDFGNGYSSLGLLMKYPADIIKLDKSIIETMSVSQNNLKFIRSIIYACHEFGKKVICEGVETEEERDMVREAGSDMIQGYYYYRPMEVDDLQKMLITGEEG